jgi:hypothetical protein
VNKLTRRGMIAGSATLAAVAALGGIGLLRFDKVDTCRTALTRLIGPFAMDRDAFASFVTDFLRVDQTLMGMRGGLMRAGEFTGLLPRLAGSLPAASAEQVEQFERKLLTQFVLTTNYLQLDDPRTERIDYVGPLDACGNPFARFD